MCVHRALCDCVDVRGEAGREDGSAAHPPVVWVNSTCPLLGGDNSCQEFKGFFLLILIPKFKRFSLDSFFFFVSAVQVCGQLGQVDDLYWVCDGHCQWVSASSHVHSLWRHDRQLYIGRCEFPQLNHAK